MSEFALFLVYNFHYNSLNRKSFNLCDGCIVKVCLENRSAVWLLIDGMFEEQKNSGCYVDSLILRSILDYNQSCSEL